MLARRKPSCTSSPINDRNRSLREHALPSHQIVDTGLDETSCYFADDSGEEIQHGYYFNELYVDTSSSLLYAFPDFDGGDFTYDLSRRKVGIRAFVPLHVVYSA